LYHRNAKVKKIFKTLALIIAVDASDIVVDLTTEGVIDV
jgi:hypothetical protein